MNDQKIVELYNSKLLFQVLRQFFSLNHVSQIVLFSGRCLATKNKSILTEK